MPLILHGLTPIHWALAGAVIAAVTLTLLFVANRRLGVSTGLEDVCSLVLDRPYFQRSAVTVRPIRGASRSWPACVLGGFLSAALGGGWSPTWALGMLDTTLGLRPCGKACLDVRRRLVRRLRNAARQRMHERSRHLRQLRISSGRASSRRAASWPAASSPRSCSIAWCCG